MDLHENLKGKTVVITGGSGILCREFAYAYAKQGMNVAVLGRTLSKLEEVRDKINELGGNGLAVVCDVVDKDSVINAKKVVNDTFGKVDILVNGAGGNHPKGTTTKEYFEKGDIENPNVVSFFDLSKENFNYVFDLNIVGTLIPTQVFIVDMLDNPGANVLNIASMSSYHAITKVSAYCAAKAAISNFTEWLAVHFSKVGIRCNAIAPGFFSTQQNAKLLFNEDGTPTARTGKILNNTPMDRFGEVEELIGSVLFLACEEASGFVNGACIPIDGAFAAYSGV
mgnify:CR=1 FL=1